MLEWLDNDSESELFTVVRSKKKKKRASIGQAGNSLISGQLRRSKITGPSVYRKVDDQEILGASHGKGHNRKVKK
jgi:hypothetical protein